MKEPEDIKMYYFFDEAGDPQILGRKGCDLVAKGVSARSLSLGFLL